MAEALWETNWWEQMEPPPEPAAPPRAGQGAALRTGQAGGARGVVRPHPAVTGRAQRPAPRAAVPAAAPPRPAAPAPMGGAASAGGRPAGTLPAGSVRAQGSAVATTPSSRVRSDPKRDWPQIVRIFTASRLLDVQSRLRTDREWKQSKILWIVGTHGGQGPSTQLYAYSDPVVALDAADAILQGTFPTRFAGRQALRVFGGSPQGEGGPISRVLTLAYDQTKQLPYIITVSHYRGRVEGNGRISPVADQKLGEVSILMGEAEARKVAYHLRAYIVPWMEAMALEEVRRAAASLDRPGRPG